jgi:hypothetical protein
VVTLGVCVQSSKQANARDRLLAVRDHMRPHAIAQCDQAAVQHVELTNGAREGGQARWPVIIEGLIAYCSKRTAQTAACSGSRRMQD